MQLLFQPANLSSSFAWAVGIENTFVPQTKSGHRSLDEYALMGHDRYWRDDIDRIADLGVRVLRYGVPWYRVNPAPGQFDWSWTDAVLPYLVETRGLTPIIDLVHYGTPLWLTREFLAPDYPTRVAEYAAAFAQRYQNLINHYTPLNEPAVTAVRSGLVGAWPPYSRGKRGYVAVLLAVIRGMIATAAAIRQEQPRAVFIHAEDVGLEVAASIELAPWASLRQAERWLPLDLACGLVREGHPLRDQLIAAGSSASELDFLADRAIRWDVLGVNFYPWSNRRWKRRSDGSVVFGRDLAPSSTALATVLAAVHDRYRYPLMITETSASGSMPRRLAWMTQAAAGVAAARAAGVPVVGLTWFPVFTMIDWRYRRSKRSVEHHLLHLGLWDVNYKGGELERIVTPLVGAYANLVGGPVAPYQFSVVTDDGQEVS